MILIQLIFSDRNWDRLNYPYTHGANQKRDSVLLWESFCMRVGINSIVLRSVAGTLLLIWAALFLAGKRGFIHLILLNALGVAFTEFLVTLRTRMKRAY